MGLLCFVLDLPLLPPLLLNDIKRARLRTIYKPMESINLREFHHAVTSLLPSSSLGTCSGTSQVSSIKALLQLRDGLLSWGSEQSVKKIIMISSQFLENVSSFGQMLMEAADHCISIDFIQFSLQTVDDEGCSDSNKQHTFDLADNIGEFENCTFQQVVWEVWQLASLEKKWIQDMVSDVEGPLEVTLVFQEKIYKDTDRVFCTLWPLLVQLTDSIQPCQTCRCHGAVTNSCISQMTDRSNLLCPVTGQKLDNYDFMSNGVKIGSHTVLYLPSFMSPVEPPIHFTSSRPSLSFTVLKCILLSTLSEGMLFGDPHIMVPSSDIDFDDDADKLEVNDGVFSSLCEALYSQDCGLLCTSSSDVDMRMEKSFSCYYLLLPADNRSFLARLGVQTYNPLNHERGLHSQLNWLAKESLHFRPVLVQRSGSNEAAYPSLNQRADCSDKSPQMLRGETNIAMGLRETDKEKVFGITNSSSRRRSSHARGEHQDTSSKHAASKVSNPVVSPTLTGGGSSSLSQLPLKPLLPLQTCPKPPYTKVLSPSLFIFPVQKKVEPAKAASESRLLKTKFRRIKQGTN
ncbi:hypothetical protein L7F22_044386 [Adiantum nelumboides]|nr:hypothetical protein [Adiantum nelumboides]